MSQQAECIIERLLCVIALVISFYMPAAAIGSDESAAEYYESCALSREARAPNNHCDDILWEALGGIFIGDQSQERPHVCLASDSFDWMQALRPEDVRPLAERRTEFILKLQAFNDRMHATVAEYMRQHPERRFETALKVMFAAFLHAFPCPG